MLNSMKIYTDSALFIYFNMIINDLFKYCRSMAILSEHDEHTVVYAIKLLPRYTFNMLIMSPKPLNNFGFLANVN